jgi:uncharacterized damage-inducible protein DinB
MLAPIPIASPPTRTFEPPVPLSISALLRLLDQLRNVILRVDDETYVTPPPGRPSGSIGAHVRHCLDHVTAFLEGTRTGSMSYDRRRRGTAVEVDRRAGLAGIEGSVSALLDVHPHALGRKIRLDVQLDSDGTTCSVLSTAGRELAFVISHTIHHHATMAVLLSEKGMEMPDRFGVAAATPKGPSCAR